ncbi:MAG: DUF559 domain-containing protein [Chloroflexi bacterium]|nr:DUF559 domain-containing protein [Chloroflexota bacterium]
MSKRGEVLVAIMNNQLDMVLARDQHWYRIPVKSVEAMLKDRWPPKWLAFYQTKVFGDEKHAVHHIAEVEGIRQAYRRELFPDQPRDEKSERLYWQLRLGPLQQLPRPIASRRLRRIVFIPTTRAKLDAAVEVNDLFDESPLEEKLWTEFKRLHVSAERQEFVQLGAKLHSLDFAIYCTQGGLNVETDGDSWHADPKRIPEDNARDNALETAGWSLLRFNGRQINEQMQSYCLPTIQREVGNLGGIVEAGKPLPKLVNLNMQQKTLFDSLDDEGEN